MGVDPRRPLIGFAVVAVLCVILMSLSVGQGWGTDVFSPGRPIAAPASSAPLDRVPPSAAPAAPAPVRIPAELSTHPLGAGAGAPVPPPAPSQPGDAVSVVRSDEVITGAQVESPVVAKIVTSMHAGRHSKAYRAAAKVLRRADRDAAKADRLAKKSVRKADKAAHQSECRADRSVKKAARMADRDAAKAARDAERSSPKV